MKRLATAALVSLLLASAARADVLQLTDGRHLTGTIKGATAAGVVIEVNGRDVMVPEGLVSGLLFDTVSPPPVVASPPSAPAPPRATFSPQLEEALTALRRLQTATAGAVTQTDYARLVGEIKERVEPLLGGAPEASDLKSPATAALRYHVFAAEAWGVYDRKGDLATVGRDPVVAECDRLREAITRDAMRFRFNPADPAFAGLMAGSEGLPALWACAAGKLAEVERRSAK